MLVFLVLASYKVVTVDAPILRIGALTMATAFGCVLYTLPRTRTGDADAAAADRAGAGLAAPALVHYRAALMRERDRLTGRRLWLPFALGISAGLAVMFRLAQARPALEQYLWIEWALFGTAMPLA